MKQQIRYMLNFWFPTRDCRGMLHDMLQVQSGGDADVEAIPGQTDDAIGYGSLLDRVRNQTQRSATPAYSRSGPAHLPVIPGRRHCIACCSVVAHCCRFLLHREHTGSRRTSLFAEINYYTKKERLRVHNLFS